MTPEQEKLLAALKAEPWPEIFLTGKMPDVYTVMKTKGPESVKHVHYFLAKEGIVAWCKCVLERRPETFGEGMVLIGKELGIAATQDNLMEFLQNLRS